MIALIDDSKSLSGRSVSISTRSLMVRLVVMCEGGEYGSRMSNAKEAMARVRRHLAAGRGKKALYLALIATHETFDDDFEDEDNYLACCSILADVMRNGGPPDYLLVGVQEMTKDERAAIRARLLELADRVDEEE